MTAVLPEIVEAPPSRPAGRHRAPADATTGVTGALPAERRSRPAHGRHSRPNGSTGHPEGSHTLSRAARTAGLSLAALGAVATAGGIATQGFFDDDAPTPGETAISPHLAAANLAVTPAAPSADPATSSVLPVTSASPGASSIKHDSPDSRAARSAQDRQRQPTRSSSSDQQASAAPAASSVGMQIVQAARSKIGVPYVWGATGPNSFDCSGLTQWAFKKAGISLPRTSQAQSQAGERVSLSNLKPGDLIFFYSPVSHVGIYAGNGQMIEAPRSGSDVRISSVSHRLKDAVGARRFA